MPKNLIPRAISMILRLTNQTLTTVYFPKLWKFALVIFFLKLVPLTVFIKDYRPKSSVSCLISNLVFELSTPQFTR
jgi:hypothetical protein